MHALASAIAIIDTRVVPRAARTIRSVASRRYEGQVAVGNAPLRGESNARCWRKAGRVFARLAAQRRRKQREPVRGARARALHGEELGKGGTKWSDWCNRTLPPGCVWQGQDDIVIAPSFILRARFPVPRCLPQRFSKPRIEAAGSPFGSAAVHPDRFRVD